MVQMLIVFLLGVSVGMIASFIYVGMNIKLLAETYMGMKVKDALKTQDETTISTDTVLPSNGNPPPPPPTGGKS